MKRRHVLGLLAAAGLAEPAAASAAWFGRERRYPLLIGGSSTMLHFTNALVEGFMKIRPDVDVIVAGGGSLPGLMALKRGAIDLASMSLDLSVAQDESNICNYLIARDALCLVVHPTNPLTNISALQAAAVFRGKLTNWRELGGRDAPINVHALPNKTRQRIVADSMLLEGGDLKDDAFIVADADAMSAAVKADHNAIGYVTLCCLCHENKSLGINGVNARRETILSGRYPFTRSFYYVLRGNEPAAATAFLEFAIGPKGRDVLVAMDLVPTF